jgi:hypothetical protein
LLKRDKMMLERIRALLVSCSGDTSCLPPTLLYNEGWMLRLTLSLLEELRVAGHALSIPPGCRWYSEALLPSAFLPRSRTDPLGESWTHADGVIGHFSIGEGAKADLTLLPDAAHFVVLAAKMFSKLSSGVSHARYYDQAARNVACIAEMLKRANRQPSELSSLGFYVLAPEEQAKQGIFSTNLEKTSIENKVHRRVNEYEEENKRVWFRDWFKPVLDCLDVRALAWEDLVELITLQDKESGLSHGSFYKSCLQYNWPQPSSRTGS